MGCLKKKLIILIEVTIYNGIIFAIQIEFYIII